MWQSTMLLFNVELRMLVPAAIPQICRNTTPQKVWNFANHSPLHKMVERCQQLQMACFEAPQISRNLWILVASSRLHKSVASWPQVGHFRKQSMPSQLHWHSIQPHENQSHAHKSERSAPPKPFASWRLQWAVAPLEVGRSSWSRSQFHNASKRAHNCSHSIHLSHACICTTAMPPPPYCKKEERHDSILRDLITVHWWLRTNVRFGKYPYK